MNETNNKGVDMSKAFSSDDYLKKADESLKILTDAEKEAGITAIKTVFDNHYKTVDLIRLNYEIDDTDLLCSNIDKITDISDEHKKQMLELRTRIKIIINEVSERIQNHQNEAFNDEINLMNISLKKRKDIIRFTEADKSIRISLQTLKMTVEVFDELNNDIVKQIESESDSINKEFNSLLYNAILICELSQFVLDFIARFKLNGVSEIEKIHIDIINNINKIASEIDELKTRAQSSEIDTELQEHITEDINNREKSLEMVKKEWQDYDKSIKTLKNDSKNLKKLIPTLELIRDNASNQISVLDAISITKTVKSNIKSIQGTVSMLQKMNLVTLSPERVKRLLNV